MELSRRDFLRSTAAFAAVASVLGTSSIAFAADADENCIVNIAADHCVTVRDRDTMEQVRVPIDQLKSWIEERIAF